MVTWYNLSDEERVKQVYSKYSVQQFWDWWANDERVVMEVRIKNWKLIKEVAEKYNLPYSASGVYVWNWKQLKQTIFYVRNKTTVWFGINPRKKNWVVSKNDKTWKGWGGGDNFVDSISYILIDIDRLNKQGGATPEDLKACDDMCNLILDRLSLEGWNKSYCKICSGHGVQLVLQLDVPIKLPLQIFDDATLAYITNDEFEQMKLLVKQGIGKQIRSFINKHKEELNVDIDRSVFNIGRVGALPMTKNFKHDMIRWRAIIEMKDGTNDGLSDYVLSAIENIKVFRQKNVFAKSKASHKYRIKKGKLLEHSLVRFMLDNDFPMGGINNTLWFGLKMLLRDSKIDLRSKEFVGFHREIMRKHKRTFTLNMPEKKDTFHENLINNFCINNGFEPLYKPLWPDKNKKLTMKLDGLTFNDYKKMVCEKIDIPEGTTILEDMKEFSTRLVVGQLNNREKFAGFIQALIVKYGEERTKYFFDNLFERYFCYQ